MDAGAGGCNRTVHLGAHQVASCRSHTYDAEGCRAGASTLAGMGEMDGWCTSGSVRRLGFVGFRSKRSSQTDGQVGNFLCSSLLRLVGIGTLLRCLGFVLTRLACHPDLWLS